MTVANARIRKLYNERRLKATASVSLRGGGLVVALHELEVIQGDDRLFVAMPRCTGDDGQRRDVYHPVGQKARDAIEGAVLAAYHRELRKGCK